MGEDPPGEQDRGWDSSITMNQARITFLAGCLEPAKDGVGDYTRALAESCAERGIACQLIALNDSFVDAVEEYPSSTHTLIRELRLPRTMNWQDRFKLIRNSLNQFNPSVVSLQFVSYGLHHRGLVGQLLKPIRNCISGFPVHMMMHELWIGEGSRALLKDRLVGALQKHMILRFLNVISPQIVHTSNRAYQALLEQNGIQTGILPLFGNIPLGAINANERMAGILNKVDSRGPLDRKNCWLLGIFGTLHPEWPAEPLFTHLKNAADDTGRKIILFSIGRIGRGQDLWSALSKKYEMPFHFIQLGELQREEVSAIFNSLDAGIAATPHDLLGKSASAIAMLEHGLPVIVNRVESTFPHLSYSKKSENDLVIRMDEHLTERLKAGLIKGEKQARLSRVTDQFIHSLEIDSFVPLATAAEPPKVA